MKLLLLIPLFAWGTSAGDICSALKDDPTLKQDSKGVTIERKIEGRQADISYLFGWSDKLESIHARLDGDWIVFSSIKAKLTKELGKLHKEGRFSQEDYATWKAEDSGYSLTMKKQRIRIMIKQLPKPRRG